MPEPTPSRNKSRSNSASADIREAMSLPCALRRSNCRPVHLELQSHLASVRGQVFQSAPVAAVAGVRNLQASWAWGTVWAVCLQYPARFAPVDLVECRFSFIRRPEAHTQEQQRRWKQVYEIAHLDAQQQELIAGFQREMKVLIYSGIWCGDCVEPCPLIQRIAEANPAKMDLRFVERPMNTELRGELRINKGSRVPVVLFFSEDGEWCATAGDRTLNRYRALVLKRLGPSCPTGIRPPEKGEIEAPLADWLNEVERVQLMLRLTPRLREKHQD
jgi:hypothetical protein